MTVTEEPTADPRPPPVSHKDGMHTVRVQLRHRVPSRRRRRRPKRADPLRSNATPLRSATPWHKTVPARLEPVTST